MDTSLSCRHENKLYATSIFSIFGYFQWKHELYPILHEDHENQVLFCVRSMVNELRVDLETGSKYKSSFLLKYSNLTNEICL